MSILPWKKRVSALASLPSESSKPAPPLTDVRSIVQRCASATAGSTLTLPPGVRFDAEGLTFDALDFHEPIMLCSLRVPFALRFGNCTFHRDFDARWLNADALSLKGSRLFAPFKGSSLNIAGHLDFECVQSDNWIDISVAEVGGDIKFIRAALSYSPSQSDEHAPDHPRTGAAVFAGGVKTHSVLMDDLVCHGRIFLDAAQIGGILKASGASIEAYYAHRAGTGLHRNGSDRQSVERALNQWDHLAISATDCSFEGAVILGRESRGRPPEANQRPFVAYGQINLSNAQLKGDLVCTGAKLHSAYWVSAPEVIQAVLTQDDLPLAAMHASRALIDGAVFLDGEFEAKGEVRLNSVEVRGVLRCEQATMDGRLPYALYSQQPLAHDAAPIFAKALGLARAQIGNDLILGHKFFAHGAVDLRNAALLGDLYCCGGQFVGWRTSSDIRAHDAQAASQRNGAPIEYPDQPETIAASGAEIRGHLVLGARHRRSGGSHETHLGRFASFGQVRFRGTKVGGNFHLDGGLLDLCENAPPQAARPTAGAKGLRPTTPQPHHPQLPFVGRFESLHVAGATFLANSDSKERTKQRNAAPIGHAEFGGSVTFEGMTTTVWEDSEDSWPQHNEALIGRAFFELNGLTYQRLSGPLAGPKRLIWLLHQPDRDLIRPKPNTKRPKQEPDSGHTRDWGFKTQPWEQCANVLYQMGYRRDARYLYRQQQRFTRVHSKINFIESQYNSFLGFLVGHGYRPYYALFWAFSLWILGWAIFDFGYQRDQIRAKKNEPVESAELLAPAKSTNELEPFNPALYSLDVLLPVVSLNEQPRWDLTSTTPTEMPLDKDTLTLGSAVQSVRGGMFRGDEGAFVKFALCLFVIAVAYFTFRGAAREIQPNFGAGGATGNRRAWRKVYYRALMLNANQVLDDRSKKPGSIAQVQAVVGTATASSIVLISLWAVFVLFWVSDQENLDEFLLWADGMSRYFLKITLVRLWISWQTLWGWVLISALIVGVGGTIFRSRDVMR